MTSLKLQGILKTDSLKRQSYKQGIYSSPYNSLPPISNTKITFENLEEENLPTNKDHQNMEMKLTNVLLAIIFFASLGITLVWGAGGTRAAGTSSATASVPKTKALPEVVIYNFREFPYKETVSSVSKSFFLQFLYTESSNIYTKINIFIIIIF